MAGLGDYLETVMGSPLFLGGAALASGEGFGGAVQGMAAGNRFREEARKRQQQEQMRTLAQQMASDPKSGINPTLAQLFTVQPELAGQYLIKHPEMELERERTRAAIAASQASAEASRAGTASAWNALAQNKALHPFLLAKAKADAENKDLTAEMMRSLGLVPGSPTAPSAPPPTLQRQSMTGNAPAPGVLPISDTGGEDPALIRVQQPQPAPQAPPSPADIIQGMSPVDRARMGLSIIGKGDAAKVLGEAADKSQLSKEARNKVDAAELDLTEQVSRIKSIRRQFKPEYQTYEEAIKQAGVGFADKFDFMRSKLSPELLQKHADFISFRRDAIDNVNRYIKEITGAAMAVPEAERIMKGIPNESDGPTAFKAKIEAIERNSLMAIARTRYLRENGFKGQPWTGNANDAARALSIEGFSRIIDQEGEAISRELRAQNPNARPEQINGAVKSMLRQKFRIDI